jgi:restriction endonuclease
MPVSSAAAREKQMPRQVALNLKALFDAIEYESEVERQFARDLDNNVSVKLFVKLPAWFKIDTPIGSYNPDWAFVTERERSNFSSVRFIFVSRRPTWTLGKVWPPRAAYR